MTYKTGWVEFCAFARRMGYTRKVAGDEAFTNRAGQILRLKRIPPTGAPQVYQEGVGCYSIGEENR